MIWRNLWRNSRRTLITMASVMFAVVLSVLMKSLQEGVFDNLIKNMVSYYSGYIQVHKNGYWDERIIDNVFPYDKSIDASLHQPEFVTALVPRIESFALTSSGKTTFGCMVIGTQPERENMLTKLKSKVTKGSYFINEKENAALLGEGLAKKLNVGVNDTIILLSQGYHGNIAAGKYPVKGLVHFGSPQLNESSVYLPLSTAQNWLSAEGNITSIAIGLDDPEKLEQKSLQLKKKLNKDYEVMTWEEMMPEIENHIKADTGSFYIMIGILYMVIAFGIFGTILMMTNERQYEFGMLVAIGMKKRQIALMLLGESLLLTMLGTLTGMALALPVVIYFSEYPIRFSGQMSRAFEEFGFEPIFPAIVKADIFITQALIVLALALIVGLYPLYYINRLNIIKAMRK
ncbi:MAG: ABC transporter permease [Bacteroidia bacterium]